MKTITNLPKRTALFGAMLAAAALLITLLAVTFATGPAQAQDASNTGPQPCGPGEATAFMEEPHEVTSGHFALFDAYWRTTHATSTGAIVDDNAPGVGVLHTNECPPLVAKTTQFDPNTEEETVTITRSARQNGMDVSEAIMHVLDKHKATTTDASGTAATAGQLSLTEYPEVKEYAPAGTPVWWLQLDDPDTTGVDETSDLGLGFSTALLDADHWLTGDEGKPMRYKFLVERYPADPKDVPHFFAYEAPKDNGAKAKIVWDSTKPGVGEMLMDPREYEALQWVFTKPGTYVLSVHLEGYVRKDNPHKPVDLNYDANWRPISGNVAETSGVKKYTIQVGDTLAETEPPRFGVSLSVAENSPGGAKVGDPIPVYNTEAKSLTYGLTGDGSDNFDLATTTNPHTVRLVVADGASLDYETKSFYDLTLSVTDGVDHEDNKDLTVDDTLFVRIDLEDEGPWLKLYSSHSSLLDVGDTVTLTSHYEPSPERRGTPPRYVWGEQFQTEVEGVKWRVIDGATEATLSIAKETETTRTYRVSVVWGDAENRMSVDSNEVTVIWERRD